jgi:ATP-dependent helicase/nuclease subunit B
VEPRPEELDPRRNGDLVLSASRLESLGACPLRYLYGSVLRVRPPDDPELDPDRWLDPLARGGILHQVFEGTLREAAERGIEVADPGLEDVALEVLFDRVARARREIPSPGDGVVRREALGLEEDVRSFVRMLREEGAPWVRLELGFGLAGEAPLPIRVEGGEVHLRGAVDRVDEDLQGLHVVDYKTGRPRNFQAKHGVFDGGRRLQHAIYAEAVDRLLEGEVVGGAYHFPTRRGENGVFRFDRERLAAVPDLVGHLLDGVAEGRFVPTDSEDDCTWCDYAEVCRVRVSDWGRPDSPLARWSREHRDDGTWDAFEHLAAVRDFEE